MKRMTKHFVHYTSLIAIAVASLTAFMIFSYDRYSQSAVAIALASGYISWGVLHHYLHKDLYLSVVIEYLVIALLGLVVIFSLVFRA